MEQRTKNSSSFMLSISLILFFLIFFFSILFFIYFFRLAHNGTKIISRKLHSSCSCTSAPHLFEMLNMKTFLPEFLLNAVHICAIQRHKNLPKQSYMLNMQLQSLLLSFQIIFFANLLTQNM